MPEATKNLPLQAREIAYEVVVDEGFGRYAGQRKHAIKIDPHKSVFPERAGGKGLSRLVSAVEKQLLQRGICVIKMPVQPYLHDGKSQMLLMRKEGLSWKGSLSSGSTANYVSVSITGRNGSTRALISAEADIQDFPKLKSAIKDYAEQI